MTELINLIKEKHNSNCCANANFIVDSFQLILITKAHKQ